jgi:hypothetical protein
MFILNIKIEVNMGASRRRAGQAIFAGFSGICSNGPAGKLPNFFWWGGLAEEKMRIKPGATA